MKSVYTLTMSTKEVILNDLINGDFRYTDHARKRMKQRSVTRQDIIACAETGVVSVQENGNFSVDGQDASGEQLQVICAYEDGTLIVTLY